MPIENLQQQEVKPEGPKHTQSPESPEAMRTRIEGEVRKQVNRETGLVEKLQADPSTTAKTIELRVLQSLTDVAYSEESDHEALKKGYGDLQREIHTLVLKTLKIAS